MVKLESYLCVSSSFFRSPRKNVSKNLSPVSCSDETKICSQTAEIQMLFQLSAKCTEWMASIKKPEILKSFSKGVNLVFLKVRVMKILKLFSVGITGNSHLG